MEGLGVIFEQSTWVKVEHLSPPLRFCAAVKPRNGDKREDRVVQMWWLSCCIAGTSHVSKHSAGCDPTSRLVTKALEVRVVVQSPLRPQNDYHVTALPPRSSIDDNARGGSTNHAPIGREDVDAFVNTGNTPRLVPERLWVPVLCSRSRHGNDQLFWNEEPRNEKRHERTIESDNYFAMQHV